MEKECSMKLSLLALLHTLLLTLILVAQGCGKTNVVSTKKKTDDSSGTSTTPKTTDPKKNGEKGPLTSGQYRSFIVKAHSRNEVSTSHPLFLWASDRDPGQNLNQNLFKTDSHLYIRAKALSQPSQGSRSNFNKECTQYPIDGSWGSWGGPYSKLKLTIGLRYPQQSSLGQHHFFQQEVTINTSGYSDPIHLTNPASPFAVDIYNAKWNNIYPCSSSNPDQFCDIWGSNGPGKDCVSLEIQIATDESIRLGAP